MNFLSLVTKLKKATNLLSVESKVETEMAERLNDAVDNTLSIAAVLDSELGELTMPKDTVLVISDTISISVRQIADNNAELAQLTSQYASKLAETDSSVLAIIAKVQSTAQNAKEANTMASRCLEITRDCGQVVDGALGSLAEISKAGCFIADITATIDEIAFQTNLLALNAAVQAARIGEQGRGFAVIAAELRHLNDRCASAANAIKSLVQDNALRVEQGEIQVFEIGEFLTQLVDSVEHEVDAIAQIVSASEEHIAGFDHVNRGIKQMGHITHQISELVEGSCDTILSISEHADDIQSVVTRFTGKPHDDNKLEAGCEPRAA